MRQRSLGKTGLEVTPIGLGCYPIGGNAWGPIDDREAVVAIRGSPRARRNLS